MRSALARKSLSDLTRRKSRALFAVSTLALAVASIGIFALPELMDRSMQAEVTASKLPDVTVVTGPLALDEAELARLRGLPNVRAVEPRAYYRGRIYVGERRADAYVLGVPDFVRQEADVVHVASGRAPRAGEVLTDVQNANQGLYDAGEGDGVRIIAADGSVRRLALSGEGRNLNGGQDATEENIVVLYATPATVASLSGVRGYSVLAFRLDDVSPAAVDETVEAVRGALGTVPGFAGFVELPEVRPAGEWPGKAEFEMFADFFYVVTLLALLSAFVLIANTMTTLVAEQTSEIGMMKALGGRRRQIASVYLRTALLLGAIGTAVGLALGIALSNVLVRYFGSTFFAVDVGFGVDPVVLAASVVVGLLCPPLAALPAIRRGTRVDLREALEATGSAVGGQDSADQVLRRVRFLPRTAQIGLRSVGRRRRRSLATAVIVALAVGNLLAVLGLAAAVSETTHREWRDHGEDVKVVDSAGLPLDERAARLMRSTPGVAEVEPMFVADVVLGGEEAYVWSVQQQTMFGYRLADGRWFTPAEERDRERVTVIERNLARATGTELGDTVRIDTSAGPLSLRVVGISANQQESGLVLFVPITTVRAMLGAGPAAASDYWVRMTSRAHDHVDRTTTLLEDRLTAAGYQVGTEIEYVEEADNVAMNRSLTGSIGVLGFLIVAISMVALANAITMSVIERTREIGILRTLGARARDVRAVFAVEGVVLAVAGWLLGIPVGYVLHRGLVWLLGDVVNVDVPVTFPLSHVLLALAGTVVLALLVLVWPIRRAVRFRPGEALRYA